MIGTVSRGARERSGAAEGDGKEGLGDAVGVVAEEVALEGEVAGDGFDAEGTDAVEVGLDGGLASSGVEIEEGGRDGRGVDEGVIEDLRVRQMRGFFAPLRMTTMRARGFFPFGSLRSLSVRMTIHFCAIAVDG